MNLIRSEKRIYDGCKGMLITSRLCSGDNQNSKMSNEQTEIRQDQIKNDISLDELTEPTNCCMSGCTNCVWIQYAEKLSNTLEHSDVDMQKLIMEKVQDPNMRAFLSMELRFRNLIK